MSIDSSFDTPEHFERTSDDPSQRKIPNHDQQHSSPGGMMDRALGYASEHRNELLHTLGNGAKANPIAAVLATVGGLGLIAAIRSSSASAAGGAALGGSGSARERIQQTAERMRNGTPAGSVLPSVTPRQHRPDFGSILPQDPVMLAVMGLALGAAIGAMLPASNRERDLVDLAKDKLSRLNTGPTTDAEPSEGSPNEAEHLTRPAGVAGMEGSDIVGDETDSRLPTSHDASYGDSPRPPGTV